MWRVSHLLAETSKVQLHEDTRAKTELTRGQVLVSKGMQPYELCKTSCRGCRESRNIHRCETQTQFSCGTTNAEQGVEHVEHTDACEEQQGNKKPILR